MLPVGFLSRRLARFSLPFELTYLASLARQRLARQRICRACLLIVLSTSGLLNHDQYKYPLSVAHLLLFTVLSFAVSSPHLTLLEPRPPRPSKFLYCPGIAAIPRHTAASARVTMDLAKTLVRSVVRAFYETKHILIIDALVIHSAYV